MIPIVPLCVRSRVSFMSTIAIYDCRSPFRELEVSSVSSALPLCGPVLEIACRLWCNCVWALCCAPLRRRRQVLSSCPVKVTRRAFQESSREHSARVSPLYHDGRSTHNTVKARRDKAFLQRDPGLHWGVCPEDSRTACVIAFQGRRFQHDK